jgi:NAD(P)-dependent dehydrogenase (short-subunit alcohol dehydrogenase family)
MSTVTIVTGANSGIGRATAIHLANQGHEVYGTVRDAQRAASLLSMAADAGVQVRIVQMDIAEDASVARGMAEILQRAGRVDVLVNNAGVGGNATVEESTPEQYLDVMNINVCGAVRCLRHVLPGMRERRSGSIVNISSVAGRFGAIGQAPYVASKWALEGLSDQLAFEMAPFGIRVVVIEPGVTKSSIFGKNVDTPNATGAYGDHYRRMFSFYAAGRLGATDPFEVAALIHEAITTDHPQLRYACSWGGPEVIGGRARMTDAEWVALGAIADDDEYYTRYEAALGVDIRPPE